MRDRILDFVDLLRERGLAPSVSETLDAVHAVASTGVARETLRAVLAATLLKDPEDRPVFDEVFDRYFALPRPARTSGERRRSASEGLGSGGSGEGGVRQPRPDAPPRASQALSPRIGEENRSRESRERARAERRQVLAQKPFCEMDPQDVEQAEELVAWLARRFRAQRARRMRASRRGVVDLRRTVRRSVTRGGVPLELFFRRARPGRSDLLALVDLSYSTATAAHFLLSLLAPASGYFRRVTLLGYVAEPVEIAFERGEVIPTQPLDLHARSDFGRVLQLVEERYGLSVGRNTVLLVLGDARNNRRPPRADLLAALRRRCRTVVWVNPEPEARWNTGDSVMAAYERYIDLLCPAWNLATLAAALTRAARGTWGR